MRQKQLPYFFIIFLLIVSFSENIYAQQKKNFTIIVDAGHGGHDSGTMGNKKYKEYEKDVALKVALKFGKLIEDNMKDVNIIYTRKSDVFITLKERPNIANRKDADLFVSIHCNANPKSSPNGAETYILGMHKNKANFEVAKKENSVIFLEDDYSLSYQGFDPNSVESIIALTLDQERYLEKSLLLASLVQKNFTSSTPLKNRGVKQAGFWVLAQTYMPSILTELGFLSNDKDAKLLMSDSGQNKLAKSLYNAFKEYKKYWDDQTVVGNDLSFESGLNDVGAVVAVETKTSEAVEPKEAEKVNSLESPVSYAIQFTISRSKLKDDSHHFKGLKNVNYYKDGSIYKYIYYENPSYSEVTSKMKDVKAKGFKDAFVVAFRNGERISLDEARNR
ncbi:MAG: N-acetylmuramoyl-L-alanine amidase [Flavobacteriales bacterium]|nr:N-acetylmuramoyl-L-alanine amidase [Flavobacteriales bacterium]